MKVTIILEPSKEGGYTASVPAVPGCVSEGKTKEEARANIREALISFLELEDRDLPPFKPGDTVRVHTRIKEGEKERIQIYEGLVIARSNAGANRSFNVRKISHGVGVERIFQEASPKVATVEVVQPGKVRRSKLYYIRELEGRAAKIEREVQTQVQMAAKAESAAKK